MTGLEGGRPAATPPGALLADVVAASAAVAATRSADGEGGRHRRAAAPGGRRRGRAGHRVAGRRAAAGPAGRRLAHAVAADGRAGREPSLTVAAVDGASTELADAAAPGPRPGATPSSTGLLSAATDDEQQFLVRLLTGELRQGALEGVVLDAVAAAAEVPAASVRRAFMLSGRLPETAAAALAGGVEALEAVRLEVGRPVRPDARQPGLLAGRRARRPGHRRHRGVQARRRPHPGAPGRRRRPRLDPHAARGHRRRARAGRAVRAPAVRTPPSSTARPSPWTTTAGRGRSRTR